MKYIPIKTRRVNPPQDDIADILEQVAAEIQSGDVVVVTSKIVALHEGRCVLPSEISKEELVRQEADYLLETEYRTWPLTIVHNTLLVSAGLDESNSGDYYALLPSDSYASACWLWQELRRLSGVTDLGVIITDSHLVPLRSGVINISLGVWGIEPVRSHVGNDDLFGRKIRASETNLADSLAAGATAVCGESSESTPVVLVRDVPNLVYTDKDCHLQLLVHPNDDIYRSFLSNYRDIR